MTREQLIRRHLMFFALKQVMFVIITGLVILLGVLALAELADDFIKYLTPSGGGFVESIVMFFFGLFVVLILGVVLIFVLAIASSILAGIVVNYIATEIDMVQRNQKFSRRVAQSIVPTLAGIGALMLGSYLIMLFVPDSLKGSPLIGIAQFLLLYIPANYYFDRKYYLKEI